MDEKHFKCIEVLGSQMAYVDTGECPVVLFQHGNPRVRGWLRFVSPSAFASWVSSILAGRSLGSVQFLNRCGMTA